MNKLPKNNLIILTLFSLMLGLNSCGSNANTKTKDAMETEELEIAVQENLLRHVVLFKFNEKASEEIVENIEKEFSALPEQIAEIHSYEWGINNSPEGLNNGLTHCFFVTFLSEEDRAKYLPHPAHQKFVALIGPYVDSVTVVDYWTK